MNFLRSKLNNERGFTMAELLIAGAIGVILLGVTIMIFTNQEKLLREENDATKLRAKGRLAIKALTKELRMMGFGLPPTKAVTDPDPLADGSTITYRTNLNDIRTTTPPGSPGDTPASGSTLNVVDSSGFSSGDNIVIYDPAYRRSEFGVVNSKTNGTPDTLTFSSAISNSYVYAQNAVMVTVNKYNTVTIALSGTNIIKTVDGTPTTLVSDVAATSGLQFDFYGETATSLLQKVGVTINLVDPNNTQATIEFKTDVILRNIEQ